MCGRQSGKLTEFSGHQGSPDSLAIHPCSAYISGDPTHFTCRECSVLRTTEIFYREIGRHGCLARSSFQSRLRFKSIGHVRKLSLDSFGAATSDRPLHKFLAHLGVPVSEIQPWKTVDPYFKSYINAMVLARCRLQQDNTNNEGKDRRNCDTTATSVPFGAQQIP